MPDQTDVGTELVAVVGPTSDMVKRTEVTLEKYVTDICVIGFDDGESFLRALNSRRWRRPIIIADTAARRPSIEEGLFSMVGQLAPQAKRILFTANRNAPAAMAIRHQGLCERTVDRHGSDQWARLAQTVGELSELGFEGPSGIRHPRQAEVVAERLKSALATGETELPLLRNSLAWILLKSVCMGLLGLAGLAVLLGVYVRGFWELIVPAIFGVLVLGLLLLVIRRIERGPG